MTEKITISISYASTRRKVYRDRFRIRVFSLPVDDWNALGRTLLEEERLTAKRARLELADLVRAYPGATVQGAEVLS